MNEFFRQLKIQRWDDHRFYHHSRINQSLHFVSAITFVVAYGLLFTDPAMASLLAWLVSMTTRQSGHFFFEPLDYDAVNDASQEHKEAIKVGYNLRRKIVLLSVWGLAPLALLVAPTLWGLFEAPTDFEGFARHTGLLWLAIGVSGLVFRTVHLFFIKDVMSGLVWMTKILTDPFHDIYLYHKAPLALLRGEMIEPRGKLDALFPSSH
jgi:type IV secretory pathway VirB3-like protein